MKGYLPESYATAVLELIEQGYDEAKVAQALTSRLVREKKTSQLGAILSLIKERIALGDGELVDVFTAHEQDEKEIAQLSKRLEGVYGKKVTLRTHVDPNILGGIILKNGDEVINYSIQNLLSELHTFIEKDKQHNV